MGFNIFNNNLVPFFIQKVLSKMFYFAKFNKYKLK